jgi:hypothetical protein
VALWAFAAFGFGEPAIRRVPTQVLPSLPPPAPVKTFSVLARPAVEFATDVCPPITKPSPKAVPVLTDLYYRVKNPNYFADPQEPNDLVTHVHELSHGVSNRLHASTVKHGIYVLDGKGIVLRHPKVTIEQIANSIPKDQRGQIYDLYMVKQRKDWNKSPIYLADEWTAYVHGALAHKQLRLGVKRKETYDHAREMEGYVRQMVKVIEKNDPDYPDMAKLKNFIEWQSDRFTQIAKQEP